MSEVDTPTKFFESVNSVNLTEANQADLYSSDSPEETQPQITVSAPPAENRQFVDLPVFSSEAEATEKDLAATPSELVALIQELRFSNSNLLNRVNEISQVQTECNEALLLYKERSHVAESMLSQQTTELEAAYKTAQLQQILLENLTAQLESSQERVAQLERECSLTQASYNEQTYQLVQKENTCRELRTRLNRQQHLTLQFKVALKKCLEVSVPSHQSKANTEVFPEITTKIGQLGSQSFFPKAQPIPPWSAQPQSPTALETDDPNSNIAVEDSDASSSLPQAELSSTTDLQVHSSIEDTSQSEEADWQDLVTLLEAVDEPVTANLPQETTVAPSPIQSPAQLDESLNEPEPAVANLPNTDSKPVSSDQTKQLQLDLLHQHGSQEEAAAGSKEEINSSPNLLNPNWPSPVIYPSRPAKGRKSLAAIELPTFSSISAQQLGVSS